MDTLKEIVKHQVGVIELSFLLDIDVVSEIFIRINLQGKHNETYWSDEFPKAIVWLFFNTKED